MEGTKPFQGQHSVRKMEKDTSADEMAEANKGQPQKKKIKLDRSSLSLNLSKPSSISNGIKKEIPPNPEHVDKKKDGIKSPPKSSDLQNKKEIKSPQKLPIAKPPAQEDDDNDELPLAARAKLKKPSSSQHHSSSHTKTHPSSNGELAKIKSDPTKAVMKLKKNDHMNDKKVEKHSKKHSSSSNKIKSSNDSPGASRHKTDGIKKIKTVKDTPLSPKIEGVKKNKADSDLSPKTEGVKKIKTVKGTPLSPKIEGVKKNKADSDLSPKTEGVKKIKSENSILNSPKCDVVKKVKSDSTLSGSPKHGESKKTKIEHGLSASPKTEGVKKIKSESSSHESPKHEGVKKVKSESSLPVSPKKEVTKNNSKSSTEDSDDDLPLTARIKVKVKKEPETNKSQSAKKRKADDNDDDDDDYKPLAKTKKKSEVAKKEKTKGKKKEVKKEKDKGKDKEKKVKKEPKQKKPEEEVWKWWEEEKHADGIKWLTLEHKGPYFPPAYEPLPDSVKFYYDGNVVKLSAKSEEVAGFYAKMLDHEYTSKKIFSDNFFGDWRKEMNDEERKLIKDLSKCDFKEIHAYYVQKNEERKNMSKEEKLKLKEKNEEILQEYGFCIMDGHRERVGNFKIEPPGLFRGRGDHPKQGKLKKRVEAKDITINIGKGATIPILPEGQKWKAASHDNKVTWLACWIENIQGSYKYVMLNPTSRIKGEKDWQKYETARKLKVKIGKIRSDYTNDWTSKEMRIRQRGVALYFIDRLALRAGHEKDEDTADTVGCCSLRVEHIKLHRKLDGKDYVVEFDFLGKDSIHYHNLVEVEKRVFKNLELFKQGKTDGDDLFDRLSTASLNKYLSELMENLSAKVFRTYNASMTLQDQLNKLTVEDNIASKVLGYNRANRAVAILCNHQRSAPKTFEQSMSNLQQKIEDKRKAIKETKKEVKDTKSELKSCKTATLEKKYEKKKSALARLQEQLFKLEVTQTDKEENKEIALGTSKLNYLDPRISISWCRKNDVPIEKIYNKTQRQKFAWAVDMTEEDFVF